ncbi:MAG: fused MFS/spermidine synthase [Acidobacteriota bacterium]
MNSRRFLPLLLLLFIGSGCAALIYEVVWFQLLQLVIGSSAISLAVLLGTFMGGLCLGSLLLPRYIPARHHPLAVYALLEIGIGVIGFAVLVAIPLVGSAYAAWAGSGILGLALRGIAAGVCLLPPTVLMGATLPALSRWVETTPRGVSWLGFFYAGNTAGAVLGAVLAGFYLLRVYDMPTATYVAVLLNGSVAVLAYLVARATGHTAGLTDDDHADAATKVRAKEAGATPPSVPGVRDVYIAIALSGMTALGAEVVWTRLLSLTFGGTTYTFSLILATFLLGLGIGSSAGAAVSRNAANPRMVFGICQALLGACIAWAGYMLTESLPYWPIDPSITSDPWYTFQLDVARSLWVVLPGAILWGASFPLALAASVAPGRDPARIVGGLFAANTVGAIVGSLGAGALVAWMGSSQHVQQTMMVICALSALLVLQPAGDRVGGKHAHVKYAGAAVAIVVAGFLLARAVGPIPGVLVGYGRFAATRVGQADYIYVGEGYNSSVAVSELSNGVRNYHNAGKVQASSEPQDMRLQRMLGHLTTLLPESPKSVVVIGCGAGVTAGAVSVDPRVERLTIAEIEPLVVRTVSAYFSEHNFDVVRNPKVRIRIDDARHYLLTTGESFDAITSDPLDPWVKGAAMLYSKEFFELVKRRLNPGGAVTLFVQLYESSEEAVKSEIATFFDVFPNGAVFANTFEGAGYDLVLVGQADPIRINLDAWEERLRLPEYATVRLSLGQIGFSSAVELLSTFSGQARDLRGWLENAQITRDRNLRLQYLAGLGLNLRQGDYIYRNMVAYRQSPDELFIGSPPLKAALWEFMRYQ